eukprot:CAMPEP_0180288838 /NCGR_PEP_ID=MMETSP0988-20121125/14327_1 /TAXON_ID=697907 /ORGANISM="non described non described, Strain CCMP2293" /LENGTH=51 /DNA_ID=CAMNT_0022263673 /DNA_START=523 /DNA_END=678 /DNA_ORIENTATION=-
MALTLRSKVLRMGDSSTAESAAAAAGCERAHGASHARARKGSVSIAPAREL